MKNIILASLLLLPSLSHAVTVSFDGVIDQFNVGPFAGGDSFSGSFTLDESIMASGVLNTYDGVVDDFQVTIAGVLFTGENGSVQQFSSANGATDFWTLSLGGAQGSVAGTVGVDTITSIYFDWRGSDLFGDPTILAHDLATADFNYRRVTFGFDTSDSIIDNAQNISFGSLQAVPVPAAVWLFGSGLLGLVGVARRKKA